MNMEKVISYLGTNRGNGQRKSLNRLRELLRRLGNPEDNLTYIHITGTNGKGSTASLFQSVLREAGFNVGLFTSPHLEYMNERIRMNNEYISDEELTSIVDQIEPIVLKMEEELNEKFYAFELLTTVAFLYFQNKEIDFVILEAGIGGRIDATNVIKNSVLSVITSIGFDHMTMLGDSKKAIMNEKVQILKEKGSIVIGPVEEELQEIALNWADKVHGQVSFIDRKDIQIKKRTENHQVFDYQSYNNIKLSLLGRHQVENACIVIEGARLLREKCYPLTEEVIYRGIEAATWAGRFEKIFDQPLFYIDGAHNEASVNRLIETLIELFPKQKFHFVVGMMKDKDYLNLLEKVYPLAKKILVISPDPVRGFDAKEVAGLISKAGIQVQEVKDMTEVLEYIETEVPKDEIVIQFGSLYLVGALKEVLSSSK